MAKKKKKENKAGLGGAISKVKAKPSAKRLAERKANIKAPAARSRKGSPRVGRSRARGSGK